ncbi:MAG: hypothetical protein K9N23_22865 [Akkermansiaceae bacterium]|nr:hypothetical protein [Akkermansiaceae bacterium]MCF7734544.1 hypothetical protein [Akkermansiaceae bacterium]
MRISNTHPSNHSSDGQSEPATPKEIIEVTKRTIGGLAPYLCFGVAQHEAWLKAAMIGATPDHDRCVRMAEHHLRKTDPAQEAVMVIHAGMLYVAACKAGMSPGDIGWTIEQAMRMFLPEEEAPEDEPATDY